MRAAIGIQTGFIPLLNATQGVRWHHCVSPDVIPLVTGDSLQPPTVQLQWQISQNLKALIPKMFSLQWLGEKIFISMACLLAVSVHLLRRGNMVFLWRPLWKYDRNIKLSPYNVTVQQSLKYPNQKSYEASYLDNVQQRLKYPDGRKSNKTHSILKQTRRPELGKRWPSEWLSKCSGKAVFVCW